MNRIMMVVGCCVLVVGCSKGKGDAKAVAVGAQDYWAGGSVCEIAKNDGAIKAIPGHDKSKDGKGLVYAAVKPGRATIKCKDGKNGGTVEVRDVATLRVTVRGAAKLSVGDSTSAVVVALDSKNKQLALGSLAEGVKWTFAAGLSGLEDHGNMGLGRAANTAGVQVVKAGPSSVSVQWRGKSAEAKVTVKP